MSQYSCDACEKSFNSEEALSMHKKAKHPETYKLPLLTKSQKKKIRNGGIAAAMIAVILFLGFMVLSGKEDSSAVLNIKVTQEDAQLIPPGAVHWHPKLTIIIDGRRVTLPPDIGHNTGRIIDTHLSGMRMSPTHTHESDGTIHLENNNPSSKPETVTLGYFFYVWGRTFNSTCIFDYCTDKGMLTMTVNGKENTEFERYLMRDGDQIRIEYASFPK